MRKTTTLIGLLSVTMVLLSGCSGGDGNGVGIGGSSSGSGGTTSTNPGRTSVPFTGGTSNGGSSSSGGKSGAVGGATGTTSNGTSTCPIWPAGKVLPLVGAQFYGPDPGPCFAVDKRSEDEQYVMNYGYSDGGKLTSKSDGGTNDYNYEYDEYGRIVSILENPPPGLVTVEYGGSFIQLSPQGNVTIRYELDASGYPLSQSEIDSRDGSLRGTLSFVYENCRMVSMYYTKPDGISDPSRGFTEIAYDAEGHIATRTNANTGRVETYNYSCW